MENNDKKETVKNKQESGTNNSDRDQHLRLFTACFPAIPSITVDGVQVCPICGERID